MCVLSSTLFRKHEQIPVLSFVQFYKEKFCCQKTAILRGFSVGLRLIINQRYATLCEKAKVGMIYKRTSQAKEHSD